MKKLAFRVVLACLAALALTGAATMAGGGPAPEATEVEASAYQGPRSTAYFANYHQDPSLLPDLAMLVDSCQKGYMTHVIVGLFHCDWRDRSIGKPSGGCISLNGTYLNDPTLQPIWETVKLLRSKKVKVIASFGGGGVGDFRHLLDPAQPEWYPLLRDALKAYGFDGLDMDIEEGDSRIVNTSNVKRIIKMLRKDLGDGFILTSAPVASALTGGSNISPGIDYAKLIKNGWFTWYNLQFYNGFGDVLGGAYGSPDYESVLEANRDVSPRRFVVGVPTNPDSAGANYHALSALAPKFEELARKYPHFGGVYGWTYQEAQVEGRLDPVGWTRGVAEALGIARRSSASGPGQTKEGAASPASTALYTFQVLGGSPGMAIAVNARGDSVGWTYDAGLAFIVPSGGEMRSLGTFPNGHGSLATAINSGGDTVGLAVYEDFDVGAFLVTSGQPMTDLGGPLGGRNGAALAINDTGSIVGWSYTAGDAPQPHAFLRSPAGDVQDLGTLAGGTSSHATAINGAGNIAGGALDATGSLRAFTMEGAGHPLSLVPFKAAVGASQVTAIEASGKTAGWAVLSGGFDAFVCDPRFGDPDRQIDLFGTRIGSQSAATGMNDSDQIVGWYLDGEGRCRAFLLPGGFGSTPLDLNDLVENPPPGDWLMIATGINAGGQIVGQTLGGRPFLLTPAN